MVIEDWEGSARFCPGLPQLGEGATLIIYARPGPALRRNATFRISKVQEVCVTRPMGFRCNS